MAGKNTLTSLQSQPTQQEQPKRFSAWLQKVENKNSIVSMIGNENEAGKFISSISSAVAVNPQLQKCDFPTVVSAGLLANALKLSMSPSIGHCYILPFEDKKNDRTVATFVLGWKGYVQLAERSGYYEQLNVVEINEGEVVKIDNINEVYEFRPIEDDEQREKTPTVGYYAFFRYNAAHGGFFKAIYWSKKKMLQHAARYSKAFKLEAVKSNNPKVARVSYEDYLANKYPPEDAWKYSSFWYVDFDGMARKTMIRQLIGKWGVMSVDFQKAYESDGSFREELSPDAPIHYSDSRNENDENLGNVIVIDGEPGDAEIAEMAKRADVDNENEENETGNGGTGQTEEKPKKAGKSTKGQQSIEDAFFNGNDKKK